MSADKFKIKVMSNDDENSKLPLREAIILKISNVNQMLYVIFRIYNI